MVHQNRFRFSCEYADDKLDLIYYNYRHLNPAGGRWIHRGLLQKLDGYNLYAMVKNAIISGIDQ